MKKILLTIIGTVAGAALVHAQGGLITWTDLSAGITTNTTEFAPGYPSTAGGTSGKISTWTSGNHYFFALLAATTTNAADEGNPAGPNWSVVDIEGGPATMGTNTVAVGGIAGDGGANGISSSLNPEQTYFMMVVGWSASVGTSWAQVSADFADNFAGWLNGGEAGYSTISTIVPGSVEPAASIFGNLTPGAVILYALPIPEPTTLALAAFGGLSMLLLRRRKP